MEMEFTGERFVPQIKGNIELEHIHRYLFACDYTSGKDVLDIACGEGYGSARIAQSANKVYGVDVSLEAVKHAKETYPLDNIEFLVGSCDLIPLPSNSVDVVISFETIEHHDKHEEMMSEIKRVLRQDGILIISSPDKQIYTIERNYNNIYHVKELFADEFKCLITNNFKHQQFLGQKITYGSAILSESTATNMRSFWDVNDNIFSNTGSYKPIYLISVASDQLLPEVVSSIYDRHEMHSESAGSLFRQVKEKESMLDAVAQELRIKEEELQKTKIEIQNANSLLQIANNQTSELENTNFRLRCKIDSAIEWQKKSWLTRATHRWRHNTNNEITPLFKRIERSIRKRRKKLFCKFKGIKCDNNGNPIQNIIEEPSIKNCKSVTIITTKHTLFVAHLIQRSLSKHIKNVTVETSYSNETPQTYYIVICPQMFTVLPNHYLAFQMEQSVSSRWFTDKYITTLKNADTIFDYSEKNITYLLSQHIPYQKIFHLPIGSFPSYAEFLEGKNYKLNRDQKSFDILFYGDPNCERRKVILDHIGKNFKVHVCSEVFGEEMINLIKKSRIVLNIHYYENALLETTRIYEVLSLGVPIISELSSDMDEHKDLRDIIDFVNIDALDEFTKSIEKLLNDIDYYNERVKKIADFTKHDQKFDLMFNRFLLAKSVISFDEYANLFPPQQDPSGEIKRWCLTLPETPLRKIAFSEKNHYSFKFFEGLRHNIGWIGCGMSYKYLMKNFAASNAEMCVICEDDVVFSDLFGEKLTHAMKFLQHEKRDWHIFSGIIAHLHPNTKVIDVVEFDGVEYIIINKMTSMVMNIYSQKIAKMMKDWDETITDDSNTIDRYIENQDNLVVVTTLPFLAGHAEDLHSTLWGQNNSMYNDMIAKSTKDLHELVKQYKNSKC